jgi:signal transduction histidine kinase
MTDNDDQPTTDAEWLVNQIAHALRNPIFAAAVQAEALQLRVHDPAAVIATGEKLHGQLQRLSHSIDEMLLFGRPVSARLEPLSINELLNSLTTRYRNGDRQEPAEIEAPGLDPDIIAHWDRNAVTVILERILDNAVQHTDAPHAIRLLAAPCDGDRVELVVSDRGAGIPDEILEQAKLPFFPQHSGRPGLGLAIADKFVRFLGGRLEIESTEGQGTTVRCTLPLQPNV